MKTIKQIRQTPIDQRTVIEEYTLAKHEHRQPICVYCQQPLVIYQERSSALRWDWDESCQLYRKTQERKGRDRPFCLHCRKGDWDFIYWDQDNLPPSKRYEL